MSPPKDTMVYVVIGASRGIGRGLALSLLGRPSTTVVATVRTDAAATSLTEASESIAKGDKSTLHIVQFDCGAGLEPVAIRELFAGKVSHIDVLIFSAGHITTMAPALDTTAADMRASFEVNAIAPLMTFQALWPVMSRSHSSDKNGGEDQSPKFIVLSSSVGSMGMMEPMPGGSYGPSKAAVNWITKALHFQMEKEGLVSVALHPGFVKTAMGQSAADDWGVPNGPRDTVEDSVADILKIVDGATRKNFSGKFVTQKGQFLDW